MLVCVWNFEDEVLLRGEECKTREKFNFSRKKKDKMVILVENGKFSRYWMMKWTAPLNSSREI